MDKQKRHEKAEKFRQEIALATQRASAIRSLVAEDVCDETNNLKIRILLQKPNFNGCEKEYAMLLHRLIEPSNPDASLRELAIKTNKKWHA